MALLKNSIFLLRAFYEESKLICGYVGEDTIKYQIQNGIRLFPYNNFQDVNSLEIVPFHSIDSRYFDFLPSIFSYFVENIKLL